MGCSFFGDAVCVEDNHTKSADNLVNLGCFYTDEAVLIVELPFHRINCRVTNQKLIALLSQEQGRLDRSITVLRNFK